MMTVSIEMETCKSEQFRVLIECHVRELAPRLNRRPRHHPHHQSATTPVRNKIENFKFKWFQNCQ